MKREEITANFIKQICNLYGDYYDDTEEDSSIGGEDWKPGQKAGHKSLRLFQEELEEKGIKLSTGKIRKILITGGVYSTELSRSIAREYERYDELPNKERVSKAAEVLDISESTVRTYLPYERMVYKEERSDNAKAIKRWRDKKSEKSDARVVAILEKVEAALTPVEIQVLEEHLTTPGRMRYYSGLVEQRKKDMENFQERGKRKYNP